MELQDPTELDFIFTIGGFASCIYEDKFWIAILDNYSEEFIYYSVKFMYPGESAQYYWLKKRKFTLSCSVFFPYIIFIKGIHSGKG